MSIVASGITKRFGDFVALDHASITVPEGSLTALLGPSGSGKSTLLRVIAGLERPDSGTVIIDGTDVTGVAPQRRGIGFVFQHYAAFKHMTVWENVAFGLKVRKHKRAEVKARVQELLELVHLEGFAKRLPSQLSGGQRQRMALARALAVQPRLLLLDEPFGALDAQVRHELRDWLGKLHEESGVTTILVTHDREEAMEVASQIVVMRDGRVEQSGEPRELYRKPATRFVMEFLGPVAKVGDALARPHDVRLVSRPGPDTIECMVDRVVHLGFETRVHMVTPSGDPLSVQLTGDEADTLELRKGDIVYALPGETLAFDEPAPPRRT